MFQTKVVEKIKTHFMFSNFFFFFFENRAVYDIMCELGMPQKKIWRTRIACWIPKATNTHSESAILNAFPLQQWLHERAHCYVLRDMPVLFHYNTYYYYYYYEK